MCEFVSKYTILGSNSVSDVSAFYNKITRRLVYASEIIIAHFYNPAKPSKQYLWL